MSNSRLLKPEEKVYVTYKDNPPARVIAVEKRGRKHYLLLRWDNLGHGQFKPERWVKDTFCTEYNPTGKGVSLQEKRRRALSISLHKGRVKLAWWQKLIVKLQNWWYGED